MLASLIPWDSLASVYCRKLDPDSGRLSVDIRYVIAALIVKHKLRLDDRGTIDMIKENIYLQYFCGLKSFTTKALFDPSLFVDIRKRLGGKEFDEFNQLVIEKSERLKSHQARIKRTDQGKNQTKNNPPQGNDTATKNKGILKVDATVADQEITYPNDLKLLNTSRENLERIVDILTRKLPGTDKPRLYRRVARKSYLNVAKKKRKTPKEIRRGIKQQLQYVSRDLKVVDHLLSKFKSNNQILDKMDIKLVAVIKQVFDQQKQMYEMKKHTCEHRIVNLFQPHVRPMVRGKDKNKTEFGSKINISEVNGFCRINRLSWESYNESGDLKMQVEKFKQLYGCYPKTLLGDKIYLTRENRRYLKDNEIEIVGSPLGRPPKIQAESAAQKYRKKKKAAKRNHVEGKFGQAKRGYGLNNIKARLSDTSESWVNTIFFVMNLTKLLEIVQNGKGIFVSIYKSIKLRIKRPNFLHIFNYQFTKSKTIIMVG